MTIAAVLIFFFVGLGIGYVLEIRRSSRKRSILVIERDWLRSERSRLRSRVAELDFRLKACRKNPNGEV